MMGEGKKEVKRMAVNLRERPVLSGKDAERFLNRSRKNEEAMKKFAERKMKEYNEQSKNTRN
jgi:hypothetical protein